MVGREACHEFAHAVLANLLGGYQFGDALQRFLGAGEGMLASGVGFGFREIQGPA